MKSFNSFIKENVGASDQNMAVDMSINPSAISNPNVVRRLNAYVGAIANMEYMLPEQALEKLRSALDHPQTLFRLHIEDCCNVVSHT